MLIFYRHGLCEYWNYFSIKIWNKQITISSRQLSPNRPDSKFGRCFARTLHSIFRTERRTLRVGLGSIFQRFDPRRFGVLIYIYFFFLRYSKRPKGFGLLQCRINTLVTARIPSDRGRSRARRTDIGDTHLLRIFMNYGLYKSQSPVRQSGPYV